MLKSWTVENFKSISERITLDLAPLTIFAGENSSGKSTVIQSILLVAQTLQSRSWGRCIVLNGNITRLGSFNDILSSEAKSPIVSLGFELTPSPIQQSPLNYQKYVYMSDVYRRQVMSVRCNFSFSADGSESRENLQLYPRLESTYMDISYHDKENRLKSDEVLIRRRKSSIDDFLAEEKITPKIEGNLERAFSFSVEKPKSFKPRLRDIPVNTGKPLGCYCKHFLPQYLAFSYDGLEAKCNRVIESLSPEHTVRPSSESEVADAFEFLAKNSRATDLLLALLNEITSTAPTLVVERVAPFINSLRDDFTRENWRKVTRHIGLSQRRTLIQRVSEDDMVAKLKAVLKEGHSSDTKVGFGPFDFRVDQSSDYIDAFISDSLKKSVVELRFW